MFLPPEVPTDQQTFTDRLLPQQLSVEQTAPAAWQPGSRHLNLRRPFARFMTLTSSRQHELHRRDSTVKAVLKASSSRLSSPAASVVELSKSRLTTSPMHSYTSPAFRRKSLCRSEQLLHFGSYSSCRPRPFRELPNLKILQHRRPANPFSLSRCIVGMQRCHEIGTRLDSVRCTPLPLANPRTCRATPCTVAACIGLPAIATYSGTLRGRRS